MSTTTEYNFNLPTVGGDTDNWGTLLNSNWSLLDSLLSGGTPVDGIEIDNVTINSGSVSATGGTMTGMEVSGTLTGTLTNLNGPVREAFAAETDQNPTLNPDDGPVIKWTLNAGLTHSPTIDLDDGEYITLLIIAGTGSISWSGITWLGNTPPLIASQTNQVELWKIDGAVYGRGVGATS